MLGEETTPSGNMQPVVRRVLTAAVLVPAYVFAALVFGVFIVALGIILGSRVVDAVRDNGPTYSARATKRCLEKRGRTVKFEQAGTAFVSFRVESNQSTGGSESTLLSFARTPDEAARAENSDSERARRRGNVLFPELVAGAVPRDSAIDACIDTAREGD